MRTWRIVLVLTGGLLGLFGVFRLLTEIPFPSLVLVAGWLVAAVVIHDGIVSTTIIGIGALLHQGVPDRARRYLQFALIAAGLVTVIALPMIYRQGSQPTPKALLLRDYATNLLLVLGIVAGVSLLGYVVDLVQGRVRAGRRQ